MRYRPAADESNLMPPRQFFPFELENMSSEDVEFSTGGVTLRGWFFAAKGSVGPRPLVFMGAARLFEVPE